MGHRRRFHGEPVTRLIVSVPVAVVQAIDALPTGLVRGGNRSEFVREAIMQRLETLQAAQRPAQKCNAAPLEIADTLTRARTGRKIITI